MLTASTSIPMLIAELIASSEEGQVPKPIGYVVYVTDINGEVVRV